MELRIEIDARLEDARQQLERLAETLGEADSELQESLRPRIGELRELRRTIAQQLTQLDASEEDDFDEQKVEIKRSLAELESGVQSLRSKLGPE